VQFLDVAAITHFTTRDRLTHAVTAASAHVRRSGAGRSRIKARSRQVLRIHRGTLLNLDTSTRSNPGPAAGCWSRVKDPKRTELEVARDRVRSEGPPGPMTKRSALVATLALALLSASLIAGAQQATKSGGSACCGSDRRRNSTDTFRRAMRELEYVEDEIS